jgi:hypothetical protein
MSLVSSLHACGLTLRGSSALRVALPVAVTDWNHFSVETDSRIAQENQFNSSFFDPHSKKCTRFLSVGLGRVEDSD